MNESELKSARQLTTKGLFLMASEPHHHSKTISHQLHKAYKYLSFSTESSITTHPHPISHPFCLFCHILALDKPILRNTHIRQVRSAICCSCLIFFLSFFISVADMPAPITSLSSSRTVNKAVTHKTRSQGQIKKTRVVRRRGRVQDAIGSEDEIEREVGTDSESEDDRSFLDSDSDLDTESASEDVVPNGHFTPGTSQSPGDRGVLDKDSVAHLAPEAAPFFNPTGEWSEMVADETINGPAELPVIEFADFNGQVGLQNGPRSRKPKKTARVTHPAPESTHTPLPPPPVPADDEVTEVDPVASTSRRSPSTSFVKRPPGQTARQAYQQRLESDPSYVPTVGGFWGHDDRLLDKDLRSLSGWWRGRWQGRGQARGSTRGRGRGGYFAPPPNPRADDTVSANTDSVPPIEREWTHDGFEEMKQREEQRRATEQAPRQSEASQPSRGTNGFRGRGFGPLRGGRASFGRGGYASSPTRSRVRSPFSNPGRVWFAMKPELMWTKQHEGFLYFDSALKSRQSQGPGLRVKLPGNQLFVVKTPPRSHASTSFANASPSSVFGSDAGDRSYAVCLPKRTGKERGLEAITTKSATPAELFTSKSDSILVPKLPTVHNVSSPPSPGQPYGVVPQQTDLPQTQPETSQSQLEQLSFEPRSPDPARSAKTEEAVLKNPSSEVPAEQQQHVESSEEKEHPSLPTIQTVFTPPLPQSSPAYGSPYAYPPALPPGVAINQHGMTYELATGRPVYLQAPSPMYNPRPVMHSHMTPPSMPFVSGHMHQHSAVSPDFLAQPTPHTPPVNGFIDPSTGTPIFAFPRQTSRIEIRAPSANADPKSPGKSSLSRSSALRTNAAVFEPSRSADNAVNGFFPSYPSPSYAPVNGAEGSVSGDEGHRSQHMADPAMMGYSHYPQPYYYPEAYGYVPYMDMSQQPSQYEIYPAADSVPPQGAVYY